MCGFLWLVPTMLRGPRISVCNLQDWLLISFVCMQNAIMQQVMQERENSERIIFIVLFIEKSDRSTCRS